MTELTPTQTPPPDRPRRFDRLTCWLIGLTVVAVVLVLVYAGYRHALRRSIETRLQAIRDAGYPATAAEVDDWHPMPEGLNACVVIISGAEKIDSSDPMYELLPLVGDGVLPDPSETIPSETLALIELLLKQNSTGLAELHRAARIEQARWPIQYSDGIDATLPGLGNVRHGVRLLTLEAMLHAERGNSDMAVASTLTAFRIGRSLQGEPILICHLVRIACDRETLEAVERCLQHSSLTDAQLAGLSEALELAECPDGLLRAMLGECATGVDAFQKIAASPLAAGQLGVSGLGGDGMMAAYTAAGLLDLDALSLLNYYEQLVDAASSPPDQQAARLVAAESWLTSLPEWRTLVTQIWAPGVSGVGKHFERHLANVHAARLTVAVERYRLAHGTLPEGLEDLAPQFVETVPLDPFDGNAMRYAVTPSGYAVYSIGEDGNDDGGVFPTGTPGAPGTDIGMFIRTVDLPPDDRKGSTPEDAATGEPGTRVTTDPADYVAVVQAIRTKGLPNAVSHFPQAIPSSATNVQFRYHPPTFRDRIYLRTPLYVQLRFTLGKTDFEAIRHRLSSQQDGTIGRMRAGVSRIIPEGFDIILVGPSNSRTGRDVSHGAATKDETREVFLWSYGHSWPLM